MGGPLERVSEGEVRNVLSQGEPLMQEKRNANKKNAGVHDGPSEQDIQQEYRSILDSVPLDPGTFTHGFSFYQTFARLDNQSGERILNLIHTTVSMLRAKDAITNLPSNVGEDFSYGEED